jgi:FlaA1/EpsC-like NDP-sugar epimerase
MAKKTSEKTVKKATRTDDKMGSPPPQRQKRQPGIEREMTPRPESQAAEYLAAGKLKGQVALITGGDSGIGRAVSVAFAKEGADVAIVYLNEREDASQTQRLIEEQGRRCLLIEGDIGDSSFCDDVVSQTVDEFGRLDILVNNAAEQHVAESLEDISDEQLHRTFQTNIFDQGSDRRVHAVAGRGAGGKGHPRQRSGPGADLDPADSCDIFR